MITYQEFLQRRRFSKEELVAYGHGTLVKDAPSDLSRLPIPPFLMFDRITAMEFNGSKGKLIAEKDVQMEEWFFQMHFVGDPVQPGCLGLDAVWQLLGFYASVGGGIGLGRALAVKEVEFSGQIRPYNKVVRYEINVRRFTIMQEKGVTLIIGHGNVSVDDELIYEIKDAKVGLFRGIAYPDYPNRSENSVGGILKK